MAKVTDNGIEVVLTLDEWRAIQEYVDANGQATENVMFLYDEWSEADDVVRLVEGLLR